MSSSDMTAVLHLQSNLALVKGKHIRELTIFPASLVIDHTYEFRLKSGASLGPNRCSSQGVSLMKKNHNYKLDNHILVLAIKFVQRQPRNLKRYFWLCIDFSQKIKHNFLKFFCDKEPLLLYTDILGSYFCCYRQNTLAFITSDLFLVSVIIDYLYVISK